mmetsp:Transcript_7386/g.16856  ORF Transcript_7386/g.16856 Transcript_7386/m.16856 type:complete len:830 (+) Transcript_7386:39-2528(+)
MQTGPRGGRRSSMYSFLCGKCCCCCASKDGRDVQSDEDEASAPLNGRTPSQVWKKPGCREWMWSWHYVLFGSGDKDDPIEEFEDNLEMPTHFSDLGLKGRCLSEFSTQTLDAAWVYQRYVNWAWACIHRFTTVVGAFPCIGPLFRWGMYKVFLTEKAWYDLHVDSNEIGETSAIGKVYVLSALSAPFTFGPVYVFAFFWLAFNSCRIRSLKKKRPRKKTTTEERKLDTFEEDPDNSGEHRYTRKEILITMMHCIWYSWLSILPLVYISHGTYVCDTEPTHRADDCKNRHFAFSPLIVFTPALSCIVAGWRFVNYTTSSAYHCATVKQQIIIMQDERYGKALLQVVKKLGDPADKKSFFPIFKMAIDQEKPDHLPQSWSRPVFAIAAFFHGTLPNYFYAWKYNLPLLPRPETPLVTCIIFLTALLSAYIEAYYFTYFFHCAGVEFRQGVQELKLMIYIGSPSKIKTRPDMARIKELFRMNDEYRKAHCHHFLADQKKLDVAFLRNPLHRDDPEKIDETLETPLSEETCQPYDIDKYKGAGKHDELKDLHDHQVAFNLCTTEGVLLFRRFRRFVRTDIFNERKEVEQYINCTLVLIIVMCITILSSLVYFETVTVICAVSVYDLSVLIFLIMNSLGSCIVANDCLFSRYENLLLCWKEQTWDPDCRFDGKQAAAYFYDTDHGYVKCVELDSEMPMQAIETGNDSPGREQTGGTTNARYKLEDQANRAALRQEVRDVLDLAATMEVRLEEKQKILGFAVTKELRNRLLGSILTVMATFVGKNHDGIWKMMCSIWGDLGDQMRDYLWRAFLSNKDFLDSSVDSNSTVVSSWWW